MCVDRTIGKWLGLMVLALWSVAIPMGESTTSTKEPAYTPLEDDAGKFDAKIYDDGKEMEVNEFSFSGDTEVRGLRSEDNDSFTKIDLDSIKTIEVLNKGQYSSKRYPKVDLFAIKKTSLNGAVVELLVPRNIVICGKEKSTHDGKAWNLHEVDKIEITKVMPEPAIKEVKRLTGDDKEKKTR